MNKQSKQSNGTITLSRFVADGVRKYLSVSAPEVSRKGKGMSGIYYPDVEERVYLNGYEIVDSDLHSDSAS